MLHYEHVFGNVFERRESKCCGVLMKVKGEQMFNFRITQQLKTENTNVVPGQLFCRHCRAKCFLEAETDCIDYQDKVQSVTDTDNGFTECQTPRKKLQSIDTSPGSLHAFMNTIKSDISETYKV